MKKLKKYHKWFSIVFTVLILLFSFSGIILNHRNLLAPIDVNTSLLPSSYQYQNWNRAAVKGSLKLDTNQILVYGNIGVWRTDTLASYFNDFNAGFPRGVDNHKISKLLKNKDGSLLAASMFGLYEFNENAWHKIELPLHHERICDLSLKQDTLLILSRSYLLKTTDLKDFEKVAIPAPNNYDHKIGLFKTMWVIHSGEIYGEAGKIVVDMLGLILAFLAISGLVLFINRIVLKKPKLPIEKNNKLRKQNKWWLRWHNKLGWITAILLLITASTGIFLRPPFLIPIANAKVGKIPFSELDTDNAWFDQLRTIYFDEERKEYIVGTSSGFFSANEALNTPLKSFKYQPPASVMGITVFKKMAPSFYLVGSFEGLFLWNIETGMVYDYIEKKPYQAPSVKSRPLGNYLVSGYSNDFQAKDLVFEYGHGAFSLERKEFAAMPKEIENQSISLWNVALEIHTGRIFENILSDFYILIVPITGLSLMFIIISGFILWYKIHRKKKKENN
jgi:hypothetical protein